MGDFLVWVVWILAAFSCLASGIAVISFSNPFSAALALIARYQVTSGPCIVVDPRDAA